MNDSLNIFQYTHPFLHLANKQDVGAVLNLSDLPSGMDQFFQEGHITIVPRELFYVQLDLFNYLLLFFIATLALLRWYMPERFLFEFSVGGRLNFKRISSETNTPSLLVDLIYLTNFLFTISLLTYLILVKYAAYLALAYPGYKLFFSIILVFTIFWIYRRIVIRIVSFVFKTNLIAKQQLSLDRNVENALSIILLPMLLLALFSFQDFFMLFAAIIAFGMQVFRWFQTVTIGISNTRFSAFHFILYLCTLELIPMLIMIKLISPGNYF
jgi:hypothetical protein